MKMIAAVFVGIVLTMGGCRYSIHNFTRDIVVTTVIDKERIYRGYGNTAESYYLVYTDAETFKNKDSLIEMKFNSSDLQGSLKEGMECTFTVVGWRVPFLSMYRNIVAASCT